MSIPEELRQLEQWTYSFDIANLKRPKHSHYTPNGSLTFTQASSYAKQNKLSFGMYVTGKDSYVLGDIDHVADPENINSLPEYIRPIFTRYQTYAEYSPSRTGVRFVFKLTSQSEKDRLRGKIFYPKVPAKQIKECQINIGPPWMRFTGDELPYSGGEVPAIPTLFLESIFALKYEEEGTSVPLPMGFHMEPPLWKSDLRL